MSEKMATEANTMAQSTAQIAKEQIDKDTKAAEEIIDRTAVTVDTMRQMWAATLADVADELSLSDDQKAKLHDKLHGLMVSHANVVYEACNFIDLYLYHVIGKGELDVGARFLIDDHIRGFLNYAPALPLEALNIEEEKPNPLYQRVALPVSKLLDDPENARIPVRVELNEYFISGYLENFRFMKEVAGNPIQIVTTIPAIRTADNYLVINNVFRWYEVSDELVRQDWAKYPRGRKKAKPKNKN